jgi:hypothetical protein
MTEKRWLYFALGVTTVISIGAVGNQLVPLAPSPGLALSDTGVMFPDGTVQTTAALQDPRRRFYLTQSYYTGADADGTDGNGGGVCASGFHFASLFEILDVTSLRYDTVLGLTRDDAGQGPPTISFGWVRTGYASRSEQTDTGVRGDGGLVNCDLWETSSATADGTIAGLTACWEESNDCFSGVELDTGWPWAAFDNSCNGLWSVWCVEDYPGSGGE